MKVAISAGHAKKVQGAIGPEPWGLNEVDEARRVCIELAQQLKLVGIEVAGPFFDDVSDDQSENLNRIVNWHNDQERDIDISVHFNAYVPTPGGRGTEVCYITQKDVAQRVAQAISSASGLILRADGGASYRSDLYFLNGTEQPAILIETCFVDAQDDVEKYNKNFDEICWAIANVSQKNYEPEMVDDYVVLRSKGKVSWFGGPEDMGVSPYEGLAFIYDYDEAPHLFLEEQPPNTSGLARRLNPAVPYIAMRWDYDLYPKDMLASGEYMALVRASKTGRQFRAFCADWGPHIDTKRVADISQGLMDELGIKTDDEVEVIFPIQA
jgi:hypothetical protein